MPPLPEASPPAPPPPVVEVMPAPPPAPAVVMPVAPPAPATSVSHTHFGYIALAIILLIVGLGAGAAGGYYYAKISTPAAQPVVDQTPPVPDQIATTTNPLNEVPTQKLETLVGPGGCQGDECKQYCNSAAHAQLCLVFAKQNGFISQADATMWQEKINSSQTAQVLAPPAPKSASGAEQSGSVILAMLRFFKL